MNGPINFHVLFLIVFAFGVFAITGHLAARSHIDSEAVTTLETIQMTYTDVVDLRQPEAISFKSNIPQPDISPEMPAKNSNVKKAVIKTPKAKPKVQKTPKHHHSKSRKIAIVIDDMGMDRRRGFELIKIKAPMTLAFLPYAPSLDDITKAAKNNGHELMIHMPMEAMDKRKPLGQIALKTGMSEKAIEEQLAKAFESFDGYVGLNNHMGSRLTQNNESMRVLMRELKARDLYFIDSKTIASSVAGDMARAHGLSAIDRDVFLDHEDSLSFVRKALRQAERVASRKGYAVVIGHPKDSTIQGLKEWIPTLEEKGIKLVHASALTRKSRLKNYGPFLSQPRQPE